MRNNLRLILLWVAAAGLWAAVAIDRNSESEAADIQVKTAPATDSSDLHAAAPVTGNLPEAAMEKKVAVARCVDINRAGERELVTLPGVGPVIAQRIIVYRQENGHFKRHADVVQVKGIGPATLKKLEGRICF